MLWSDLATSDATMLCQSVAYNPHTVYNASLHPGAQSHAHGVTRRLPVRSVSFTCSLLTVESVSSLKYLKYGTYI